jgi:hypothetical protein
VYLKVVLDPGVELLQLDVPQDVQQPVGAFVSAGHGSLLVDWSQLFQIELL